MKKLILKLSIFTAIIFLFSWIIVLTINAIICNLNSTNGKLFKIENCPENLIVGHSQAEEAFDDGLIKNVKNLSLSGESIFYTYFKINEVLKSNSNIKNIFMSFTNHQITEDYDRTTIWDDNHINKFYQKYSAFMDFRDYEILFKNNPIGVLKAQPYTTRKYLFFVLKNRKTIYDDYLIGNFNKLKESKLDSILKSKRKMRKLDSTNFKHSKYSLDYLDKIIKLCKNKKVKLFLIRTPVHKSWDELSYENSFQEMVKGKYSETNFLDFKNFPLSNKEYIDESHLNQYGAKKFSLFFNKLLEKGLLGKQDKQEFINQEMKKIF